MEQIIICLINFSNSESGLALIEQNPNVFTILSEVFYG